MNSNNTNLQYSNDALNVKALFYNKKWMVYVEGKDDVLFWAEIFAEISNDFKIEEVGGYENLTPYMDLIITGFNNMVVACDKDHSYYLDGNKYINDCIVYTYGYSIENTMYCKHNINNAIKKLAKKANDFYDEIDNWHNDFCQQSLKLLPYDIINYLYNKKISCFGDNYFRFSQSPHSILLDEKKIDEFVMQNISKFSKQEIEKVNNKIYNDNRADRFKIKGHFLASGVINFIRKTVQNMSRTVSLSNDGIYALMVTCSKRCNPICPDKEFVLNQVKKAYNVLTTHN